VPAVARPRQPDHFVGHEHLLEDHVVIAGSPHSVRHPIVAARDARSVEGHWEMKHAGASLGIVESRAGDQVSADRGTAAKNLSTRNSVPTRDACRESRRVDPVARTGTHEHGFAARHLAQQRFDDGLPPLPAPDHGGDQVLVHRYGERCGTA